MAAEDLQQTDNMIMVQDALASAGIHVAGIVEARIQKPAVRHMSRYFAFTSGATEKGTDGCELWVSRDEPLSLEGRYHKPSLADFYVMSASPSVLLVSMRLPTWQIDICVAHAPYLQDEG